MKERAFFFGTVHALPGKIVVGSTPTFYSLPLLIVPPPQCFGCADATANSIGKGIRKYASRAFDRC